MDDSRFDAWTRRRFGLAVTGLAATSFGLPIILGSGAEAKNKKKKRCKKLQQACQTSGKKKRCCKGKDLLCEAVLGLPGLHCCRGVGASCTETADCCGFLDCGGGTCNE